LTGTPGGFAYNNVAFHLAGLVAERASGLPLHELAADRLFAPLGVQEWDWQLDPHGFPLCMAGLWLRATDLARVASLHLTRGRASGRQLVAPEWLAALQPSARGQVGLGCFAQFSAAEAGRRIGFGHDGDLGQWVTVQPAVGVVGVRARTATEEGDDSLWRDFPTDVHAMALDRPWDVGGAV
jgi:CubicO group peptidase (beta-lactamase class C family)